MLKKYNKPGDEIVYVAEVLAYLNAVHWMSECLVIDARDQSKE